MLLLLSIIVFFFFSRAELILLSLDKLGLGHSEKKSRIQSLLSARLKDFAITAQLVQFIALLGYALLFAIQFQSYTGGLETDHWLKYSSVLFVAIEVAASILIFVLAVVLLKVIVKVSYFRISLIASPLFIAYVILYPVVVVCKLLVQLISPSTKRRAASADNNSEEEELYYLASDKQELANELSASNEIRLFQNALDFSEVRLHECMVPRNEINSIAESASLDELQGLLVKSGYSRILVYRETKDNIIGYVSAKDLFKDFHDIGSMLRPIDFVPETMPAQKQLASFIKNKKSIAVVVDEFGGTVGLVTLEDVMEEIFGDIEDEHDSDNLIEKTIGDNEYLFSGRLEVDYLNEQYGLSIPEAEDYETLAGYIIYQYERLPSAGQALRLGNLTITIVKLSATRIELVKLKK